MPLCENNTKKSYINVTLPGSYMSLVLCGTMKNCIFLSPKQVSIFKIKLQEEFHRNIKVSNCKLLRQLVRKECCNLIFFG